MRLQRVNTVRIARYHVTCHSCAWFPGPHTGRHVVIALDALLTDGASTGPGGVFSVIGVPQIEAFANELQLQLRYVIFTRRIKRRDRVCARRKSKGIGPTRVLRILRWFPGNGQVPPIGNVDVKEKVDAECHPVGSFTTQNVQSKAIRVLKSLFVMVAFCFAFTLFQNQKFKIRAEFCSEQEKNEGIWGVLCPTG